MLDRNQSSKAPLAIGYQNCGNVGDDLMHLYALRDIPIASVLKGRKLRENDQELGAFRYSIGLLLCQTLIITGGNIFNIVGIKSYFKLLIIFALICLRSLTGRRTNLVSIGLNRSDLWPINFMVHRILKSASYVHIRDKKIIDSLKKLENIVHKPDVVASANLREDFKISGDAKGHIVYLPSSQGRSLEQRNILPQFASDHLKEKIFVITQGAGDIAIFATLPHERAKFILHQYSFRNLHETLQLIAGAKFIYNERLHGAIISENLGIDYTNTFNNEKISNLFL